MSLIEDLRAAAAELVEGDTPTAAEARSILGALVKWVEAEVEPKRAKVAIPTPAVAAAATPAAPAAAASGAAPPTPAAPVITTGAASAQKAAAQAELARLQAHIAALEQDEQTVGGLLP